MSRGPQVIYWNNMPTPYVVGRLNAIADRGAVNLEAWFNERREADRSWDVVESQWHFPYRFIDPSVVRGKSLHIPVSELRETRPDLLVSLYGDPSFSAGAAVAQRYVRRHAFRVLPTFDSWVARSRAKEAAKHLLFRAVDGAKVPGPDGQAQAERYGMPANRAFPITQSIDVEHFQTARAVSPGNRADERERLGLRGCVFIYVGRLWQGKGLDFLFDAYARVRAARPDVSLFLLGDGVDEARYRERARLVPGVVFGGFVQPADIPPVYALADVMVFPTLGDPHGLVVEEAMAAGLPVITTRAAGDIGRRLPDDEAGFIVPPADADALADRMMELADDQLLRQRMAATASALVVERTHERYARDFERFVEQTLTLPRRSTPARWALTAAGRAIERAIPARPVAPAIAPISRSTPLGAG